MQALVPVDSSPCSERALRYAADFAPRHDADLVVVHVEEPGGDDPTAVTGNARSVLESEDVVDDPDVTVDFETTDSRFDDEVGRELVELVDERDYDHVVMGHHGEGVASRVVPGSTARPVVEDAGVPVVVVP